MKFFDKLFKKSPNNVKFAPTFDGYTPIFSQFGTDIYASDVIQQVLKCIADEMKKLKPLHVRYKDSDAIPVKSNIQDVLDNPNNLMTTSEFLEKITWLLLMNYNVFIVPTFYIWKDEKTGAERRKYESLYPINPTQVDFLEDSTNTLFVKFRFWNGYETTLLYDDIIHIRYNFSVNQYMGGNRMGQPDFAPLLKTLELNETLLQGIAKSMKASYSVNAVVKYNSIMDKGKTEQALIDLENKLKNSESGFLPLDLKAEYIPIPKNANLVDDKTLKFIDEKILRNWGVPIDILIGNYSKETYESYFQKCLEPLIITYSQAFTKKLFTEKQKDYRNKIEFFPKELIFLTTEQKIELVNLLSPTGALFENEKRTIFGLEPLPELENTRYMSLNWINVENASQYQIGKNENVDVIDEEKDDI